VREAVGSRIGLWTKDPAALLIPRQFCPRIKASRRALSPRFKSSPTTGAPRCRAGIPEWKVHAVLRRRSPQFFPVSLRRTGGIEPRFLKEKRTKFHRTQAAKGIAKPVFDRGRDDGERVTQHQGGNALGGDAASKCIRKASASPWPQSVAQSFCRQFPSLQYVCRSCLSPSAFSVRPLPHRAKYQNRFCITDARNYLIVVICEMPHIISFPRIICRNQLWLK
jgi:hypothetical protein